MENQELKPCPFCGEKVEMKEPYPKWDDKRGIVYDCMIVHSCKSGLNIGIYTKHGYLSKCRARRAMADTWNQRT